jgi:hypothetical protein
MNKEKKKQKKKEEETRITLRVISRLFFKDTTNKYLFLLSVILP